MRLIHATGSTTPPAPLPPPAAPTTDAERLKFLQERLAIAPPDLREIIADSVARLTNAGQTGAARLEEIFRIESQAS